MSQRTVELAATNAELTLEIAQRKEVEAALKKSQHHYSQLLQLRSSSEQLLRLSRQVLSAQEEERKKISRELHDVIAQTPAGLNVQLGALKKAAVLNTEGLERNITSTQQLVQHSVDIVHRFARELRPTVLDDLGLIPALHTFLKSFREETGIRVSLSVFAAVEQVSGDKRTVLYRVAQDRQGVKLTKKLRPDVVVMDIAMPLLNGLEATRQIRKDSLETKVSKLNIHDVAGLTRYAIAKGIIESSVRVTIT